MSLQQRNYGCVDLENIESELVKSKTMLEKRQNRTVPVS